MLQVLPHFRTPFMKQHHLCPTMQPRVSRLRRCRLQELDLSGNQMKRAGAVAVGRAVAKLPAFERLLLNENEISADGIAQLKVRTSTVVGFWWSCFRHARHLKGCAL